MNETDKKTKQKQLIKAVLQVISEQLDDIKEFQVVSVPGESFRVDVDYHVTKPWEGKVDYE